LKFYKCGGGGVGGKKKIIQRKFSTNFLNYLENKKGKDFFPPPPDFKKVRRRRKKIFLEKCIFKKSLTHTHFKFCKKKS